MLVAWQALQSPVPSAMWLPAPTVPTVPGGTTSALTPYHAIAALWQLAPDSAFTAVWPADVSTGLAVILKPPCEVELELWQAPQSADPIGMWLPAPEVPTVPGGCSGWPPASVCAV